MLLWTVKCCWSICRCQTCFLCLWSDWLYFRWRQFPNCILNCTMHVMWPCCASFWASVTKGLSSGASWSIQVSHARQVFMSYWVQVSHGARIHGSLEHTGESFGGNIHGFNCTGESCWVNSGHLDRTCELRVGHCSWLVGEYRWVMWGKCSWRVGAYRWVMTEGAVFMACWSVQVNHDGRVRSYCLFCYGQDESILVLFLPEFWMPFNIIRWLLGYFFLVIFGEDIHCFINQLFNNVLTPKQGTYHVSLLWLWISVLFSGAIIFSILEDFLVFILRWKFILSKHLCVFPQGSLNSLSNSFREGFSRIYIESWKYFHFFTVGTHCNIYT